MSSKAKLRSKLAHDGPEPFSGLVMRSQSRYTGASSAAPALGYALPTAPLLTWKGW